MPSVAPLCSSLVDALGELGAALPPHLSTKNPDSKATYRGSAAGTFAPGAPRVSSESALCSQARSLGEATFCFETPAHPCSALDIS